MEVFKCKMCGGTLNYKEGDTVAVCEYCGSKQTLPKIDDDRRASMYERASNLRRSNEYDKAAGIYEQILSEDSSDAEAYWSLVLCRYGIEYVEEPTTHKRVITVNRAQYTPIFSDNDYKEAIAHADLSQKEIYESEAETINAIQKKYLDISQNEKPFDIFISFKESGPDGRRTKDSVLARELYSELVKEGFKVFFAPVTLEDKLGQEYEPYIFAALNSAKIMVVVGTCAENFNAVWVKNEWSRYLALIKKGEKKTLIPAYRDMNPYDLPEEFSNLFAQDMGKLGFMQDLVHGINKIIGESKENKQAQETTRSADNSNNSTIEPLLRRTFLFIEDDDWQEASKYAERILDMDPENGQAYLAKLLIELKVHRKEDLKSELNPFDQSSNYKKIMRFGDNSLRIEVQDYIEEIEKRKANEVIREAVKKADDAIRKAEDELDSTNAVQLFNEAMNLLDRISPDIDVDDRIVYCKRRIGELKSGEKSFNSFYAKTDGSRLEKQKKNSPTAVYIFAIVDLILTSMWTTPGGSFVYVIMSMFFLGKTRQYKKQGLIQTGFGKFCSGFITTMFVLSLLVLVGSAI